MFVSHVFLQQFERLTAARTLPRGDLRQLVFQLDLRGLELGNLVFLLPYCLLKFFSFRLRGLPHGMTVRAIEGHMMLLQFIKIAFRDGEWYSA